MKDQNNRFKRHQYQCSNQGTFRVNESQPSFLGNIAMLGNNEPINFNDQITEEESGLSASQNPNLNQSNLEELQLLQNMCPQLSQVDVTSNGNSV